MNQEELVVVVISFVVGLVFKRPGIVEAALKKVFRKDK